MKEVVIVSAVRTPMGSFGGSLSSVSATKLAGYKIEMTVTMRQKGETTTNVRANAQIGIRAITEPEIYQDFFISLDKSIFLEKNL